MARSAPEGTKSTWRFGRISLIVAAVITTAMFGWQAWHLYESYQAVAERDAGECPTRAVEAAYSAGERLDYLVEEIEHSLFLWGPIVTDSPLPELADRYNTTDAELSVALAEARRLSKGKVLAAVEGMETARDPLTRQVNSVVDFVADGQPDLAASIAGGPEFMEAREEYKEALVGMWEASRHHLVVQLEQERRNEVLSVGIALVLFGLAVGAWAIFLRRIRRGQAALQEEEQQRKRAEEELLQAQKMDALGLMAGGIAHDFNNLVTAIWGSASSARDQLPAEHPAGVGLARIEEAAEQANGVVRALLTFARRTEAAMAPVEIGALVDATARMLGPTVPASVELIIDHPADQVLWVEGDATQLQQVLTNLALNALEAMPHGGALTIRSWLCTTAVDETPQIIIEVADTGEGIAPAHLDRVFEPFFTTRAPGQGTGLGLSIVHGIVSGHGGTVRVESELGHGSAILVILPAIEAPVEGDRAGGMASVAAHDRDERILLVEDHEHVREIIAEALAAAGFRVTATVKGSEFLEEFERAGGDFDLLIADLDIPPPSGLESLRRVRATGAATPALLITGTAAPGLEDDVDDLTLVLRKPFTMPVLVETAVGLVEGATV